MDLLEEGLENGKKNTKYLDDVIVETVYRMKLPPGEVAHRRDRQNVMKMKKGRRSNRRLRRKRKKKNFF